MGGGSFLSLASLPHSFLSCSFLFLSFERSVFSPVSPARDITTQPSPLPPSFPKHLSLVRLALELSTSSTMTPGRSLLATCNLWLLEFDSSSDRPLSRGTTSSHHSIDSRTFHAKSIFGLGLVNFLCPPTKPFAVILHTLPIPFRVRLFRNHEEDFVRWISTKRIISDAFVEECHYSSCSRRVWNFDGVALYREGKF